MEMDTLIEATYRLVAAEEKGVFQSELWKKLNISSREGSRLARELEKRNLVIRKKQLHGGRWTYRIHITRKPVEIGFIDDVPCFRCQYESKCTAMSPKYLVKCERMEDWSLEKFKIQVERG